MNQCQRIHRFVELESTASRISQLRGRASRITSIRARTPSRAGRRLESSIALPGPSEARSASAIGARQIWIAPERALKIVSGLSGDRPPPASPSEQDSAETAAIELRPLRCAPRQDDPNSGRTQARSSCVTLPFMTVIRTLVLWMSCEATSNRFLSSTTRSASLPVSIEPTSRSMRSW